MTAAQRVHGSLFHEVKGSTRLLDEKVSVIDFVDRLEQPSRPLAHIVSDLACASDATFSGIVRTAASYPTLDGTFLFSEYGVKVTQIFRKSEAVQFREELTKDPLITVIRPGGEMSVEGVRVNATSKDFPALVIGNEYVFFVAYVAETGSFRTADFRGTFTLSNSQARNLKSIQADEADLSIGVSRGLFIGLLRNLSCASGGR
jgi:hypothetical protein